MANKEALRALQSRLAERLKLVRETAPTRNWLAVELGGHGFLMPLDQAGEIFALVPIQRVPHSEDWFLGVGNLRGHLHGVVDLARFMGLPRVLTPGPEAVNKDTGRLVVFNASLRLNTALLVDRLSGLRRPTDMVPAGTNDGRRPHFISAEFKDDQGRAWYELDLAALALDEAFLKVAA